MSRQSPSVTFPKRRMDRHGRVTIPAALREMAGLAPGKRVRIRMRRDGLIVIELN